MKNSFFPTLAILSFFSAFFVQKTSAQQGYDLTMKMVEATKQIHSIKFNITIQQRMKGKMLTEKSFIKIQRSPLKMYTKMLGNDKGEVLYIEGTNNSKALVNPGTFPYVNLNLDPFGSLMRKNQHHTIFDADFKYAVGVLDLLLKKYPAQAKSLIKFEGTASRNGVECYKFSLSNPNFTYVDYVVQPGDNLTKIANKFKVNDYMILEYNKLSGYNSVKPGQTIKVPNDYAKALDLYMDKNRYIPITLSIYDEKGLYEQFDFYNTVLDPTFSSDEFSPSFKEYGF
jgi:LysM repeat protein